MCRKERYFVNYPWWDNVMNAPHHIWTDGLAGAGIPPRSRMPTAPSKAPTQAPLPVAQNQMAAFDEQTMRTLQAAWDTANPPPVSSMVRAGFAVLAAGGGVARCVRVDAAAEQPVIKVEPQPDADQWHSFYIDHWYRRQSLRNRVEELRCTRRELAATVAAYTAIKLENEKLKAELNGLKRKREGMGCDV